LTLLLLAIAVLLGSAVAALGLRRFPRASALAGALGAVAGCTLGAVAAVPAAVGVSSGDLMLPWSVPYGSLHLGLDPLSGFFLVPIFFLSAVGAVYGLGYLRPEPGRSRAGAWFFFNVLVASMVVVVAARNGVLFLLAWELMALSSYFLVIEDLVTVRGESPGVRDAGIVYLIATHLGTAFLLAMFLLLGGSGSLEFDTLRAAGGAAPAGLLFVFALVGFGSKAGFVPFHVWLPEAHPVAPSHVSAVMSGVMIKTGIYGLLRVLGFLGAPAAWWGWTLIGVGLLSGVLGVLFALAQHDLKRLLAYHSVENIGIIGLGLGVGLLGQQAGLPVVAALGYAGALLHVVNHALFKGLLFLAAGAVAHGAGTLHIEELGGLQKRMPWTASLFLVGAAAISGLPPLNGFVSELCIYLAAFGGAIAPGRAMAPAAALAVAGLALIGGLAVACFTKAFGVVFLGEARHDRVRDSHEVGLLMRTAMIVLAVACGAVALGAWAVVPHLALLIEQVARQDVSAPLHDLSRTLGFVALASASVLLLAGLVAALRRALLRGREIGIAPTWGCGYVAPNARMQYTASSYGEPLTRLFTMLLRPRVERKLPVGLFPRSGSYETHTDDQARVLLFAPVYRLLLWVAARARLVQAGRVQVYVLYIAITLMVLIAVALGK